MKLKSSGPTLEFTGMQFLSVFPRSLRLPLAAILVTLLVRVPCKALDIRKAPTQYAQRSLTDSVGLPQNSVHAIAQTQDGYLWFATEEGLARFDGVRLSVFNTMGEKGLKDNYISGITAGRDGSLWIATRSDLVQLKDGVFRSIMSTPQTIKAMLEDRDGRLWVGCADGLYTVYNGRIRAYTMHDGFPMTSVSALAETSNGTIWLGTSKGLMSWSGGHFTHYAAREGLGDIPMLTLAASADGSLWIASLKGLAHWNGHLLKSWSQSSFPAGSAISSICEDHDGQLWIAFNHGGVAALRGDTLVHYVQRDGLASDDTTKIFEDHDKHLWIGFANNGVTELLDSLFTNFGTREGLSSNMLWSVLQARDGSLWTGTNSKGLGHVGRDGRVRTYSMRDGLPDATISGLYEGRDGSIWIGSEHGVLSQFKNGHFRQYHDPAGKGGGLSAILSAGGDDLWLGFHEANGLTRFHNGHFQHYAVPGLLNTIAIAPDGALWLGADHGGVTRWRNGELTHYSTADGLLSDFAQAIYIDRDGTVWAGTSPGGLNRIKHGRITTYTVDQGLFDLTVGAILEDDTGNLWMTCNKGIFRVSKKELNDYADGRTRFVHSDVFGVADGMRAAECNFGSVPSVWEGIDGRFFFATVAGIASVSPQEAQRVAAPPRPLLEEVLFDGKLYPSNAELTVGPARGDLEMHFTAPEFGSPERMRFRYRLANFDRHWIEVGNRRQAYYTKLPPGRYSFQVEAASGKSPWSPRAASMLITLRAHYWQTDAFKFACALAMLLLGERLLRLRTRFLLLRNQELEEKVIQRTEQLQKAMDLAEQAQQSLREQATKDALSGLLNRRSIFEKFAEECVRAQREGAQLCVIMADVDHFKLVNDSYGHPGGDRVIQEVARRFARLMRPYDLVGRYGGEEFMIVIPNCGLLDGVTRAEELRAAIASDAVIIGTASIQVTCSLGVASVACPVEEKLVAKADEALYEAKRAGRNCVHPLIPYEPSPLRQFDVAHPLIWTTALAPTAD